MSDRRENISWLVGVLVSGVVHVGAGVGAARYGTLIVGTSGEIGQGGTPIELLSAQDEAKEQAEILPPPPPPLPVLELPPVDPATQERVMRLGIRESSQNTDAWLGFNEPTEHSGVMSTLDQAQLALEPGDAGMPGVAAGATGAEAARATEPQPRQQAAEMNAAAAQTQPMPAAEAPKAEDKPANQEKEPEAVVAEGVKKPGEAEGAPLEKARDEKPTPVNEELPREGKDPAGKENGEVSHEVVPPPPVDALVLPDGAMVGPVEVRDDALLPAALPIGVAPNNPPPAGAEPKVMPEPALPAAPGMTATPAMSAMPAVPEAPQGAPGSAGSAKATPGNKSDREADAASKKGPIDVRPGKPAAGQGLEIQTVRPRWSITVQLTSVPKNPRVRIVFGPDGKVKNAAFLVGQDTGSTEVDGPLLDAIYRWTAKGKAIDQLPKNDPKAGVPLIMRIVLRG